MTLAVTPHLNFAGQAKAALDFYFQVFGGKPAIMTYGAVGQAERAKSADDVIWGQVESDDGFRIMAYDVQAGHDYDAGANAFFVSVRGTSVDEVRARWDALADGAIILQPMGAAPWTAAYGMLTDRFRRHLDRRRGTQRGVRPIAWRVSVSRLAQAASHCMAQYMNQRPPVGSAE